MSVICVSCWFVHWLWEIYKKLPKESSGALGGPLSSRSFYYRDPWTPSKTFTRIKYILLRGCGGYIFFSCTHSNNIYRGDVTQLQTQERRFGSTEGKIVSTESKRRTDQGPSFFCVNQILQPTGISSALLQKKMIKKACGTPSRAKM